LQINTKISKCYYRWFKQQNKKFNLKILKNLYVVVWIIVITKKYLIKN